MSKRKVKIEEEHNKAIRRLRILRITRLGVQLSFLFIANLGLSIALPLPVIGLSYPWTSFPSVLDMLQIMIILLIPPLLPLFSLILFNVLLSRFFCGWICPFGFAQDLLSYIFGATRYISSKTHAKMIYLKYFVLFLTLIALISLASLTMTNSLEAFSERYGKGTSIMPFTSISPDAMLFGTIPLLFSMGILPASLDKLASSINTALLIRYFILILVLFLSAKITRFWCRYVCPMGALNAIFSNKSLLGIYRNIGKCDECGLCNKICPTQIDVVNAKLGRIDSKECIMCLECVAACHTKAISITFIKR